MTIKGLKRGQVPLTRAEEQEIAKNECLGLLHRIVRLRDGAFCLKGGPTCRTALQLSHIYPKGRYKSMELDPDNVKLLCVHHHMYWWHKNPEEAWEWLRNTLPAKRLERLKLMSNTIGNKIDTKLQKLYLEKELKKLESKPQP